MAIKHGVYVSESDTAIQVPQEATASVQVIIGTAPVHMVDDPSAVVNKPVLATSATEAMKKLGYVADFSKYTLCQSMYLASNLNPVGPMVFINVLDPETHRTALTSKAYQVNHIRSTRNRQSWTLKASFARISSSPLAPAMTLLLWKRTPTSLCPTTRTDIW